MRIYRGYADGPFGQLHYEVAGEGVPVILLHQMVQSSLQFRPALPILASLGIKAVAVDLPGYGMSNTPENPPSMTEYASIVPALIEHFGFNKIVVGGHHTGASVACEVAYRYPEMVSKLVLHGVPFYSKEQMKKNSERGHHKNTLSEDGNHFKKVWDMFYGAGKGLASLEATHNFILTYFLAGETEWHGHDAVYKHDIWSAVKAINVPTLLISNTGDMLNPQDIALSEARPDFEFKEIEGGSFQFVYDDFETWSSIVAEYVTRQC